jgi:hypothetical protein
MRICRMKLGENMRGLRANSARRLLDESESNSIRALVFESRLTTIGIQYKIGDRGLHVNPDYTHHTWKRNCCWSGRHVPERRHECTPVSRLAFSITLFLARPTSATQVSPFGDQYRCELWTLSMILFNIKQVKKPGNVVFQQ